MAEEQVRWRTRWDNSSLKRGVRGAKRDLKSLDESTKRAAARFAKFGAAAGAAGAAAAGMKLVNVTREFQKLEAQLITATGSQREAAEAFKAIKQLAADTPFDLQQVTDGFNKLVNLGLTPSKEAMMAYGNTASAMGKDMNQMVEAVADATTGEFERLKEFGIKANKEGENIKFRFRGVTTTVKNNATAIEEYLTSIGQNEFAGAMKREMDTLNGAMSNFGDSWDKLFNTVSEQGLGSAMTDAVNAAGDAVEDFRKSIASGQFGAQLDALAGKFSGFGEDVGNAMSAGSDQFEREMMAMGALTDNTVEFIGDAFQNMPENIHAAIKLAAVELGTLVDHGEAYGEAFGRVLGIQLGKVVDKAGAYGAELADKLNPFDGDTHDLDAALQRADKTAAEMTDAAFENADKQAEAARQARKASIENIIMERDAALQSYEDRVDAAKEMREKWEKEQENANSNLAQFGQGGGGGGDDEGDGSDTGLSDDDKEKLRERLEKIREASKTEVEIAREKHAQEAEALRTARERGIEIKGSYDELEEEMEARHQAELKKLEKDSLTEREKFEQASMRERVATVAGDLQKMTQAVAGENRKMFEINKAASLATATVESIKGAEKTWNAYPYPWNIPMTAAHVAGSMARLSQIESKSFGGGGGTAPSASSAGSGAPSGSQPVNETGGGQGGGGRRNERVVRLSGLNEGDLVRKDEIASVINEAKEDGATVVMD